MQQVRLFITLAATQLLTSCPNPEPEDSGNSKSELPEEFERFEISVYDGGGMLPISFETFISIDSAYWIYNRYNYETKLNWIPTRADLNDLYNKLKENKIDKIKSNCEGEVFDRGGITIGVRVDDQRFEIDNSGNCFIQEKYSENYGHIVNHIFRYRDSNIQSQSLIRPIDISDELMNLDFDITISVNDGNNFVPGRDTTRYQVEFYPGYNEFTVKLNYRDSVNYYGSPVNYRYEQFFDSVTIETRRVLITWKEDRVDLIVED